MFRILSMRIHNAVFLAAAGLMALSVSGCREDALRRGTDATDGGGHAAGLSPKQASLVLAKVGEEPITLGEFATTLERMDQFDRLRYKTPERRRELLEEMITVELLAREAERRGLDKDPRTQEALRQILRDAILRHARKGARGPAEFSEAEVRAYYEAHKDAYREPERRRVSHLVVRDQTKAKKLLEAARVLTAPADWGKFVLKHSDSYRGKEYKGPAETAGDLGLVGPPGDRRGANPRIAEEVREAVFKVGQVGQMVDGVVADSLGNFHLVRLAGLTQAHARSLAEAERTIRIIMSQQEVAEKEKQLEADLRQKFPVTIDEAALAEAKMPKPSPDPNPDPNSPPQPPQPPQPPAPTQPQLPSGQGHDHDHDHAH